MEESAGICLRPSASMLVALNEGNPIVLSRSAGYRADKKRPRPVPQARRGIMGVLDRISGTTEVADESLFPFERTGELLHKLKAATGPTAPRKVVIAVPAYANDVHRRNTVDGASDAGWEVLGLINEPVAAAMATGVLRDGDGTTLIYDLSETGFDVAVIARMDGVFEIVSSDAFRDRSGSMAIADILQRTERHCRRALKDAGLTADAIDAVVLVGELARREETVEFVTNLFGETAPTRFDPEEVVGIGASVQAAVLNLSR